MSLTAGTYDLYEDQPSLFSRWFLPALTISLLLHVIFLMWARGVMIERVQPAPAEKKELPHAFKIDRIETQPPEPPPEPQIAAKVQKASAPSAVRLPEDKASFEKMMSDVKATPAAPKIAHPLLAEKPSIEPTTLAGSMQDAEVQGVKTALEDLESLQKQLAVDNPQTSGLPLLELGQSDPSTSANPATTSGSAAGGSIPGFSNLDSLLAQTGPLQPETAPILMPADLLFDYDSYTLQDAALSSIGKLGLLIQKNPQVNFIIEGHTDSFGAEAYNMELSRRRAESVKACLVQMMGIDPMRISTRGFGETRLIAPASGTVEQQQINRRVEIVMHAPEGNR